LRTGQEVAIQVNGDGSFTGTVASQSGDELSLKFQALWSKLIFYLKLITLCNLTQIHWFLMKSEFQF